MLMYSKQNKHCDLSYVAVIAIVNVVVSSE